MHKLHISEGIVLGKRSVGEANVIVSILTREHGLLRAHVRSARAEKSKLRYGLEPLTSARFTFVRGRHEWRLTGAEKVSHELVGESAALRMRSGRVSRLLLRLIHGEEVSPALFETAKEGLSSLARANDAEIAESVETVLVLRILSHLGYLPNTPEIRPFVEADFFSLELAGRVAESRKLLIKTINESLSATGL